MQRAVCSLADCACSDMRRAVAVANLDQPINLIHLSIRFFAFVNNTTVGWRVNLLPNEQRLEQRQRWQQLQLSIRATLLQTSRLDDWGASDSSPHAFTRLARFVSMVMPMISKAVKRCPLLESVVHYLNKYSLVLHNFPANWELFKWKHNIFMSGNI